MNAIVGFSLAPAAPRASELWQRISRALPGPPFRDDSLALGPVLADGLAPLGAPEGALLLATSGEIHNHLELRRRLEGLGHRFATGDPAEVVLHAYLAFGLDFLRHLRGAFAFALYDRTKKRLLLARDRLGVKPLYLAPLPGGLGFASTLKALLPLMERSPRVDPLGLAEYLHNRFAAERTTLVAGVERLLPAEALCIEQGQVVKRWRYWSALNVKPVPMDHAEAKERFEGLMESILDEQLAPYRPCAVALTEGTASAALLALLAGRGGEPLHSFGQEGGAAALAGRFGSRHSDTLLAEEARWRRLPYALWSAEELTLVREEPGATPPPHDVSVVLTAAGAGVVFGGCRRYRAALRRLKTLLLPGSRFPHRRILRGRQKSRLFGRLLRRISGRARQPFLGAWRSCPAGWSSLQRMQYVDLVTTLPNGLLPPLEGVLRAAALRGRHPFLDHRLVEFGLALPDALKAPAQGSEGFLGWWMQSAGHGGLPRRAPTDVAARGGRLPPALRAALAEALPYNAALAEWFRPEGVAALFRDGGASAERTIRALLRFAVWHRLFIEGVAAPPSEQSDLLRFL